MAKERLSAAPDVPTVDEAGLPGPYMSPGRRFACQKGTEAAAIDKLNGSIVNALASPIVRSRLAELGEEISLGSNRRRGARGVSQGRGRKVGADLQGCPHQIGVGSAALSIRPAVLTSGTRPLR